MDQQLIEIAVPLQGGDAPVGGGIGQPGAGIGLVLHRMAKAAQVATALAVFQARHQVGGAQIGPADHRLHPGRPGGEVEQKVRLLFQGARLHGDAAVEAGALQVRLQVGRQMVALQPGHAPVDPGEFGRPVAPEVLVSIQARAHDGCPPAWR